MEIPLMAQVECTDGVGGRSVFVLINPVSEQLTHLVVGDDSMPSTEHIVPIDLVSVTIAGTIQLRCSKAELEKMDPFVRARFIQEKVPDYSRFGGNGMETSYYWPYVTPGKTGYQSVEDRQFPVRETAVGRGSRVEATDGYVGHVDEFVVNPENGQITHLVMREGHLWGKKDVIIPVSAMGDFREDTVSLKIDKHQIEALPTFPLHTRWS